MPLHNIESPAEQLAMVAAASFLLCGLLTGLWKYAGIRRSSDAQAPVYVDIAHRTSLMYAFAAVLLGEVARRSAWPNAVNLGATAVMLGFFASAIAGYVLHGLLRDTDNQFRQPHAIAGRRLPRHALLAFMIALSAGEIGGFLVLFTGMLRGYGWF